jgi:hypothetical protein
MSSAIAVLRMVILLAAVLALSSCWPTPPPPPVPDYEYGVDFSSHLADYSILIRNNTNERLIAFKGDLAIQKLIGGIPAHTSNHGLPRNPALFDRTEDFPLILITEAQYGANKYNLSALKNTPFTRVYVFYDKSGFYSKVYEIADGLGGNNWLTILNPSVSTNVELCVRGPAGETLCYAPAGIFQTTLRLNDGDYYIYPVYKRYNPIRDLVETAYSKNAYGNAWYKPYSFGEELTSEVMNLKELLQDTTCASTTAWVVVNNETSSGWINFIEGTSAYTTAGGIAVIQSGPPKTFQIDMPMERIYFYSESVTKDNWRFGLLDYSVPLQTDEEDSTPLGPLTVEQNKMYTVTVTGDVNLGTLKAWISDIADIPASEIGVVW